MFARNQAIYHHQPNPSSLALHPWDTWSHFSTSHTSKCACRRVLARECGGSCQRKPVLVLHFCAETGIVRLCQLFQSPLVPASTLFFIFQATFSITWMLTVTAGRILSHNWKQTIWTIFMLGSKNRSRVWCISGLAWIPVIQGPGSEGFCVSHGRDKGLHLLRKYFCADI